VSVTKTCERCGCEFLRRPGLKLAAWVQQRFCDRQCRKSAGSKRERLDELRERVASPEDPLLPVLIRYGLKRGPGENGYSALPGLHWFDLVDLGLDRGIAA
jgi:hypothetical protein